RWDSLSQMASHHGMLVVNECGTRDIWPPLAHSVTFGYGLSGTGGFQVPGVEDRCHDVGHSGYFTKEFIQEFWVPFIKDGTVTRSKFEEEMAEAPWWISVIGLRPILPWLMWILIAGLASAVTLGVRAWPFVQSPRAALTEASTSEVERQKEGSRKATAAIPPLTVIHSVRSQDSQGFPLLQLTLRNNENRAQVVTSVKINCRIEPRFGAGGEHRTRPLMPLDCWDVDVSSGVWKKSGFGWLKEFTFTPSRPLFIDADDAATITVRINEGLLRPWPGPEIMPGVDEKSEPEYPEIPRVGFEVEFTFVSDLGYKAASEWISVR